MAGSSSSSRHKSSKSHGSKRHRHHSSRPSPQEESQQAEAIQNPAQFTPEQNQSYRESADDVAAQPHYDHSTEYIMQDQDYGYGCPPSFPLGYVSPSEFLPREPSDQEADSTEEEAVTSGRSKGKGKGKGKEKAFAKRPLADSPGSSSAHSGGQGPSERGNPTEGQSTMGSQLGFSGAQEQGEGAQPGYSNPQQYQEDVQYTTGPSYQDQSQAVLQGSQPWPSGGQGSQRGYSAQLQDQQGVQYPAEPSYQDQSQAVLQGGTGTGPASQPQYNLATGPTVLTGQNRCGRCRSHNVAECVRDETDEFSCRRCSERDDACSFGRGHSRRYTCTECCKRNLQDCCVGLTKGDCGRCKRRGLLCHYPRRRRPHRCTECFRNKIFNCDRAYGSKPCTWCKTKFQQGHLRDPDDDKEAGCEIEAFTGASRCSNCVRYGIMECERKLGPGCPLCERLGLHCDYRPGRKS